MSFRTPREGEAVVMLVDDHRDLRRFQVGDVLLVGAPERAPWPGPALTDTRSVLLPDGTVTWLVLRVLPAGGRLDGLGLGWWCRSLCGTPQ